MSRDRPSQIARVALAARRAGLGPRRTRADHAATMFIAFILVATYGPLHQARAAIDFGCSSIVRTAACAAVTTPVIWQPEPHGACRCLVHADDGMVGRMTLALLPRVRIGPESSLVALVEARTPAEGCTGSAYPGLWFHRVSGPQTFRKTLAFGLTLMVAVQGRKVARFGERQLDYDPLHYLVLTGEGRFEGRVVEATADEPYLGLTLAIPAEIVAKTLVALSDHDAVPRPEPEHLPAFVARLDEPIAATLARLLRSIADPLEREMIAPLVLEELVFRLLRSDAAAVVRRAVGRDGSATAIERAMSFIRAHAAEPLSVEALARHVAMSPSHFAHRFRAIARVSPMRYLKQVRLHDARKLLLADGSTVGEAALRVGYESPSHFTRDFKGYFGTTPAGYVRAFRALDTEGAGIAGSGK